MVTLRSPKSDLKLYQKLNEKKVSNKQPKRAQNGSRNGAKMEPKRVNKDLQDATPRKWVLGGPRGRPGVENYSKMKPKWSQNRDRMETKIGKKNYIENLYTNV